MTKLILGTVQFGLNYGINNSVGKPDFDKVKNILDFAFNNSIQELDTADVYGDAQLVLKEYLNKSSNPFVIMSKFIWDRTKDFNFHLSKTLTDLNLKYIEGYYFHRFEDFKNFSYFDQVRKCKADAKFKYLGVSLYTEEELEFAINHSEVNLIQLPFNLFDRSEKKQKLLSLAKKNGIKIYIRSAFLQGLFFKDFNDLPPMLLPLKANLEVLKKLSDEYHLSMEELALGYINSKDFIDGILVGVDSIEQLRNNINYSQVKLTNELITKIESIEIEDVKLLNPANWN